jgi:CBS domain containing-hemolysin-like protein
MKTRFLNRNPARQSRGGWAVLVILILLVIMVVFVAANTATVNWLRRQVRLVDERQTQRLARMPGAESVTNQPLSK